MEQRKGFFAYRIFFENAQLLSDAERAQYYDAIFNYGLNGIAPDFGDNKLLCAVWLNTADKLHKDWERYNKGCNTTPPPPEPPTATAHPDTPKKQERKPIVKNLSNELQQRKQAFMQKVSAIGINYDAEVVMGFIQHWAKEDTNGKMLFENVPNFNIASELKTWDKIRKRNDAV